MCSLRPGANDAAMKALTFSSLSSHLWTESLQNMHHFAIRFRSEMVDHSWHLLGTGVDIASASRLKRSFSRLLRFAHSIAVASQLRPLCTGADAASAASRLSQSLSRLLSLVPHVPPLAVRMEGCS
mmetsp:Transcript_10802/g.17791  ORF Transcript_10802/g.17791 Transcript_10802/m.17791 type:complete len:126 (+) Transcript_10802:48-425(+)